MSRRLFQAYVMVDWSAAAKPTTGPDSIWVGVLKRNVRFQMAFEAHNPATRADAERLHRKRARRSARKSERVLVGFDFPLGFPRGTAAALKLSGAPWRALMDFVAAEMKDKPNNDNNRFQVGAKMNRLMTGEAFPFWGAPARDAQTMLSAKRPREHGPNDLPEYPPRRSGAERRRPRSGSSIIRARSAARRSLACRWSSACAMRARAQDLAVRDRLEAARRRPISTASKPCSRKSIPRSTPAKPQRGRDQGSKPRCAPSCERFAALDEKGQLAPLFGPAKDDPRRESVEREEGWILGAPL